MDQKSWKQALSLPQTWHLWFERQGISCRDRLPQLSSRKRARAWQLPGRIDAAEQRAFPGTALPVTVLNLLGPKDFKDESDPETQLLGTYLGAQPQQPAAAPVELPRLSETKDDLSELFNRNETETGNGGGSVGLCSSGCPDDYVLDSAAPLSPQVTERGSGGSFAASSSDSVMDKAGQGGGGAGNSQPAASGGLSESSGSRSTSSDSRSSSSQSGGGGAQIPLLPHRPIRHHLSYHRLDRQVQVRHLVTLAPRTREAQEVGRRPMGVPPLR